MYFFIPVSLGLHLTYKVKIISVYPVRPTSALFFTFLHTHKFVVFPVDCCLSKKNRYFSFLAQKLLFQTLTAHRFIAMLWFYCMLMCRLTWHFLLSRPLVTSSNSSPILKEQEQFRKAVKVLMLKESPSCSIFFCGLSMPAIFRVAKSIPVLPSFR